MGFSLPPQIPPHLKNAGKIINFVRKVQPRVSLVKVTLIRSGCSAKKTVKESLRCLGLKKVYHSVIHKNTSPIRGYINEAKYYLKVEDLPLPKLQALGYIGKEDLHFVEVNLQEKINNKK